MNGSNASPDSTPDSDRATPVEGQSPIELLAGRTPAPEDVRLLGMDLESMQSAHGSGVSGTTPMTVAIRLSRPPTRAWADRFSEVWDKTAAPSTRERPRIARVTGSAIELQDTTPLEVRTAHWARLESAVEAVNAEFARGATAPVHASSAEPTGKPAIEHRVTNEARSREATRSSSSADVVILTAIPPEYAAVRTHLKDIVERVHPSGTVYEVGTIGAGSKLWRVAIAEVGAGNEAAAFEAERAVEYFGATHLLFVGVAGGLKDVGLGDVVAATKVYGYESGKDGRRGFQPRPEVGQSSYDLVQRARAVARTDAWIPTVSGPALNAPAPMAFIAPIAAGAKVVANRRGQTATFLRQQYSDALAVEMEGSGLLRAAHARPALRALVVRGISDLVDQKAGADAAGWQEEAARHAAAFAAAVLTGLSPSADP